MPTRLWRTALFVSTMVSACAEPATVTAPGDGPPAAVPPSVQPWQPSGAGAPTFAVTCGVDVTARQVRCGPERNPPEVPGVILGGQGSFIQLTSSNPAYNGMSEIFSANVTIQNLIGQAIGTANGTTPTGVKVFFHSGPNVTGGTGSVSVSNADGTGTFTAANQPYFLYSQLLAPQATSGSKTWEWDVSPTVTAFAFSVFVQADVRYPTGYVEVSPTAGSVAVAGTLPLTAVVRDVVGRDVGGSVIWGSSNLAIASVSGTGALTATATGVADGTATITATSAGPEAPGTTSVTVSSVLSVSVSPTADVLRVANGCCGWTRQLTPTVVAGPGVSQAVTYTSQSTAVAVVSTTGLVTASNVGQTEIVVASVVDPTKTAAYSVTVLNGCVDEVPVELGYSMPFTTTCTSGDRYSYTPVADTWIRFGGTISTCITGVGQTNIVVVPFILVTGSTSTWRASPCFTNRAWAFVKAGTNHARVDRSNSLQQTSFYAGLIQEFGAQTECDAFTTAFGVSFSVDITGTCTTRTALIASRDGTLAVTATSAAIAVTITVRNALNFTVVTSSTSSGPGETASVSLPTTSAEVYNVSITPAIAGETGSVAVTISP